MNVATLVSVTTAVVGTLFAAMTWSISDAPGLRGLRWFSASSMCGAGYACAMAAQSSGSALAARIALRFVVLLMALHASSWLVYSSRRDGRPLYRFEKAIVAGTLCLGIVGLFPGTLYATEPWDHPIPWLGIQYNDARSTTLGNATFVYLLGAIGLVAVRAVLRFRRGDRNLAGEIVGLFALALFAFLPLLTLPLGSQRRFALGGDLLFRGTHHVVHALATEHAADNALNGPGLCVEARGAIGLQVFERASFEVAPGLTTHVLFDNVAILVLDGILAIQCIGQDGIAVEAKGLFFSHAVLLGGWIFFLVLPHGPETKFDRRVVQAIGKGGAGKSNSSNHTSRTKLLDRGNVLHN